MIKSVRLGIVWGLVMVLIESAGLVYGQVSPAKDGNTTQMSSLSGSSISVILEEDDNMIVDANGICIIPIRALQKLELGSISLVIEYPDDVLDILDVNSTIKGKMLYTLIDGVLKIEWYSLVPIKINPGDELIRLRCRNSHLNPLNKTKKQAQNNKDLSLRIRPISMISNGKSVNMSNVVLTYPKISTK